MNAILYTLLHNLQDTLVCHSHMIEYSARDLQTRYKIHYSKIKQVVENILQWIVIESHILKLNKHIKNVYSAANWWNEIMNKSGIKKKQRQI